MAAVVAAGGNALLDANVADHLRGASAAVASHAVEPSFSGPVLMLSVPRHRTPSTVSVVTKKRRNRPHAVTQPARVTRSTSTGATDIGYRAPTTSSPPPAVTPVTSAPSRPTYTYAYTPPPVHTTSTVTQTTTTAKKSSPPAGPTGPWAAWGPLH